MIKTSTQSVHSLFKESVTSRESSEELGEDELKFYISIQDDLKKLEQKPQDFLIENILHYSKSL